MNGILIGDDLRVYQWVVDVYKIYAKPFNKTVGIVDDKGNLLGAAIFHNFNGFSLELSYYGKRTLSVGIVRALSRIAVGCFNASRVTVVTSKKNKALMRGLLKIGFRLEGAQRCYYGHDDNARNTAVRFVLFRDRLSYLSMYSPQKINAL